jgi:hypothetical protein
MRVFEREQAKVSLNLLKQDKVGQVEFIPILGKLRIAQIGLVSTASGILANASDPASDVLIDYESFGSVSRVSWFKFQS